jgi:hypothetical protein
MIVELLKVGTEVSTPLGLGGLLAVILFFVLRQVLKTHAQDQRFALKIVNGMFFLAFTVCIIAVSSFVYLRYDPSERGEISFTNKKPYIVGIYPNDLFGPSQEAGLKLGVEHFCSNADIKVVDVNNESVEAFKSGDLSRTLPSLSAALDGLNVFAISGPSITEFTPAVIKANAESSKANMFITSAASLRFLDWAKYRAQNVPLFRISTGIDRRGKSISDFLRQSILAGKRVGFLVESGVNNKDSFGEMFLKEIEDNYQDFFTAKNNGNIQVKKFTNGSKWRENAIFVDFFNEVDLMFYLGVGNDYRNIVNAFYKNDATSTLDSRPILFSWMHAHTLEPMFETGGYYFDEIVEITDLFISKDDLVGESQNVFLNKFKKFGPAMRDQAFSFDAAAILCSSYNQLTNSIQIPQGQYIKFDVTANKRLRDIIESKQMTGVSGLLAFGIDGENPKTRLTYLNFDKSIGWMEIKPKLLFQKKRINKTPSAPR